MQYISVGEKCIMGGEGRVDLLRIRRLLARVQLFLFGVHGC